MGAALSPVVLAQRLAKLDEPSAIPLASGRRSPKSNAFGPVRAGRSGATLEGSTIRDLDDILKQPVMIILAGRGMDGRPETGRGLGVRVGPEEDFNVWVSASAWAGLVSGLSPGNPVAVTLCAPDTYRALQVKGPVVAISPATAEDLILVQAYVETTTAALVALGAPLDQALSWLAGGEVVRLHCRIQETYSQTPGPGAGQAIAP